ILETLGVSYCNNIDRGNVEALIQARNELFEIHPEWQDVLVIIYSSDVVMKSGRREMVEPSYDVLQPQPLFYYTPQAFGPLIEEQDSNSPVIIYSVLRGSREPARQPAEGSQQPEDLITAFLIKEGCPLM